jgi:putative addiction module component (TIGR02574 family)
MSADLAIESMTLTEKLALMERLWSDLSRCPEDIPSSEWHGEVLAERIAAVREGRTEFVDWDAAKKRLRDRLE